MNAHAQATASPYFWLGRLSWALAEQAKAGSRESRDTLSQFLDSGVLEDVNARDVADELRKELER